MIIPSIFKKNEVKNFENVTSDYFDENKLKKELEDILSKISGAGKVEVMIVFENTFEKIIAKDINTSTNDQSDKNLREIDSTTVMKKEGNKQVPFVVKEMIPTPKGVLVVADGANNASVKTDIKNAVKTVLNIGVHKVEVLPRK